MKLDLRQIPTFLIHSPSNDKRRQNVAELQKTELKIELIPGVPCIPKFYGVGLAHLKVMAQTHLISPFLVLEDDAVATDDLRYTLDLPDDTDCVYLGVSSWGIVPEISRGGVRDAAVATPYNEDFLRVHNMLGSHALVYVSERYTVATWHARQKTLLERLPCDIGLARLQTKFLALTPPKPFFYQARELGGAETPTRRPLRPLEGPRELILNGRSVGFHPVGGLVEVRVS